MINLLQAGLPFRKTDFNKTLWEKRKQNKNWTLYFFSILTITEHFAFKTRVLINNSYTSHLG